MQIVTTEEPRRDRPLLFVDVDGVISLFDFGLDDPPPGHFHTVDGIAHFISGTAGEHLLELDAMFELVWCSGWEEKANEYLPRLLGLPNPLPFLTFASGRDGGGTREAAEDGGVTGHWKLAAIDAYADSRPLAWVDDVFNDACDRWVSLRPAPTLLVATEPASGLCSEHVLRLTSWARGLDPASQPRDKGS